MGRQFPPSLCRCLAAGGRALPPWDGNIDTFFWCCLREACHQPPFSISPSCSWSGGEEGELRWLPGLPQLLSPLQASWRRPPFPAGDLLQAPEEAEIPAPTAVPWAAFVSQATPGAGRGGGRVLPAHLSQKNQLKEKLEELKENKLLTNRSRAGHYSGQGDILGTERPPCCRGHGTHHASGINALPLHTEDTEHKGIIFNQGYLVNISRAAGGSSLSHSLSPRGGSRLFLSPSEQRRDAEAQETESLGSVWSGPLVSATEASAEHSPSPCLCASTITRAPTLQSKTRAMHPLFSFYKRASQMPSSLDPFRPTALRGDTFFSPRLL